GRTGAPPGERGRLERVGEPRAPAPDARRAGLLPGLARGLRAPARRLRVSPGRNAGCQSCRGGSASAPAGARGGGGAPARRLAEEGAAVLIADVDVDAAEANAARIREAGGAAEAYRTDVTVPRDLERMVERAVVAWSRLDILVNNAVAPYEQGGAEQVSEAGWGAAVGLLGKAMFLALPH